MLSQFFSFKFLKVLFDQNKTIEEYTKTKFQIKFLQSNIAVDGVMSDLTFNNLEIGKTYQIIFKMRWQVNFSSETVSVTVNNGSTVLFQAGTPQAPSGSNQNYITDYITEFVANSPTVTFTCGSMGGNDRIMGDGTRQNTHVFLKELPNHEQTTQWT